MAEVSSQTLHIVARELASELNEARASLEAFGEQQDNLALLRKCNEHLHSVHGALRVAEVYGAALLAEEMGQVAHYLIANFAEKRHLAEGLDALMRAMVQLPTYLERVMSGGRDMALVLLPLLNDLRAVRGHALLSEGTLLLLNLSSDQQANPTAGAGEGALTVAQWSRKLRTRFQLGLLGWIKGERIDQNLEILSRTAEKLEHVATTQAVFQLWWVVGSVLEALREGGLEGSASIKRLLGQADREMKRLYELGEARYADSPPLELLNNLLYYVARARTNGPRVAAVRASFRLSELLPVDDGVEQARESLSAPSVKLMKTVAAAIKEDLSRVKDALDIFVRQGGTQVDELAPQLDLLKKIADTLGVLGLGELRDKVQTETADLQNIVAQKAKASEGTLLRMAATLIKVEDSLDEQLVGMIVPTSDASAAPARPAGPDDIEFRLVTEAVLRECIVNMARIKEAIAHSVEKPREAQAIDQIPQLMRGITAGLLMLGKTRVVEIMEGIDKALQTFVRSDGLTLPQEAVDRLADAIVAVEYYMETIQAGRADPWYMLDNAETCLRFLAEAQPIPRVEAYGATPDHARTVVIETHAPTVALGTEHEPTAVLDPVTQEVRRPTKPVAAPPQSAEPPPMSPALTKPVDREVDPEFVELFIEEAKDEIAKLNQFFPLWDANPQDAEALVNVRRSFHTLKGSGRMVGAQLIGDFAWSIENMLNRVINKTLDRTPDMMAIMRSAVGAVPELVEQLETGRAPQVDIAKIINTANALAGVRPGSSTPAPQAAASARRAPEAPAAPRSVAAAVAAPEKKTAPAVAPTRASSEPPMDPGLHEIYAKETAGHLAAIRKFIGACALANAPYPVTEDLHRSCHTLSGTAKTAGARQGIKIAEPLNRYIRKLYDNSIGLSDAGLAALKDSVTAIQQVVDHITESTGFFLDHGRIVNRLVELDNGLDLEISRLAERLASTNITASEATGDYGVPSATTIVSEHLRVPEPRRAPVLSSVPAALVEVPVLHAEEPQMRPTHEPATVELAPMEPSMLATGILVAEPNALEATIDVAHAVAAESAERHAEAVEITVDPAALHEQGAFEAASTDVATSAAAAPAGVTVDSATSADVPEEITLDSIAASQKIHLGTAAPELASAAATQGIDLASASEEVTLDPAAAQEISFDSAALEELSHSGLAATQEIPLLVPDLTEELSLASPRASQETAFASSAVPEEVTLDSAAPEEIALSSPGTPEEVTLSSAAPEEIELSSAAAPEEVTLSSAASEDVGLGSLAAPEEITWSSGGAPEEVELSSAGAPEEITFSSATASDEIARDSAAASEEVTLDSSAAPEEVTLSSADVRDEIALGSLVTPEEVTLSSAAGAFDQIALSSAAPEEVTLSSGDAHEVELSFGAASEEVTLDSSAAPEEVTLSSADVRDEIALGSLVTPEEVALSSAGAFEETAPSSAAAVEEVTLSSGDAHEVELSFGAASEEVTLDSSAAPEEVTLSSADARDEIVLSSLATPEEITLSSAASDEIALGSGAAAEEVTLSSGDAHEVELSFGATPEEVTLNSMGASDDIALGSTAAPEGIIPDSAATPEEITLGSSAAPEEVTLSSAAAPEEFALDSAAELEEVTLDSSAAPGAPEEIALDASEVVTLSWSGAPEDLAPGSLAAPEEITLTSTGAHEEIALSSADAATLDATSAAQEIPLLDSSGTPEEITLSSTGEPEEGALDAAFTQEVAAIVLDTRLGEEVTLDSASTDAPPAAEVVELEATDASALETLSWSYKNFPADGEPAAADAVTSDSTAATQEIPLLRATVAEEITLDSVATQEAPAISLDGLKAKDAEPVVELEATDASMLETLSWSYENFPAESAAASAAVTNALQTAAAAEEEIELTSGDDLTQESVVLEAADELGNDIPEEASVVVGEIDDIDLESHSLLQMNEPLPDEASDIVVSAAWAAQFEPPVLPVETSRAVNRDDAETTRVPFLRPAAPTLSGEEVVAPTATQVSPGAIEAAPSAAQAAPVTAAEPVEEEEEYDDSDFDPDVAAIFTEEATELLDTADHSLSSWIRDRANNALVFELKRAVHTLKGGARMAGIRSMGDLSHELETLMGLVETGQVPAEEKVFAALQSSLDELHRMRDIVAAGDRAKPASQLMRRIRALAAGEPEPAPAAVPAPAAAVAVAPAPIAPEIVLPAALAPTPEPSFDAPVEDIVEIESYSPDDQHIGSKTDIVPTLTDAEVQSALEPEVEAASDVEVEFGADELGAVAPRESVRVEEPPAPAAHAANAATGIHAALDVSRVSPELPPDTEQEETTAAAPAEPQAPTLPGRERQTQQQEPREFARVDADLLDNLLNSAGEVSIFRSRMEQQVSSIEFNLAELGRTVTRLKDQLRKIELETEAQILHRHHEEHPDRADFDPLELDRYSTIQQLTRAFAESVSDVSSIEGLLENLTREAQNLLLQQSRVVTEMQNGLMRTRMVPFQRHVQRLSRLVRQVANDTDKRAELVVQGANGELDRQVLERMLPPFEHMLRNSVVHGIETPEERVAKGKPAQGTIKVGLHREGSEMVIVLEDDGRGIDVAAVRERAKARGLLAPGRVLSDEEAMQLILEPGFSTASNITQHAGRGVGMDVVVNEIKKLGGALFTQSQPGQGVKFTIRLPFTLAITQALIVRTGEELYALPLPSVEGVARISKSEVVKHLAEETPTFNYGGQVYRLQHLGAFVGGGPSQLPELDVSVPLILIRAGEHSTALVTDELVGSREMVVKAVGPQIATIRGIAGATILGDGRIVIILDMHSLVRAEWRGKASLETQPKEDKRTFALVVDDSITVRRVTQRLLERNGMRVMTAKDGIDALSILQEHIPDVILLDIEMPRMDGYELATQVRADARLTDIPIVMITSRTGEKHRARAIEIGVNDYLGKPYQENQLLDAIEPLVQARRRKVS